MTPFVLSGQRRIPLRNIWLLLLYASELFRQLEDAERAGVEERPDDIPDLVAEVLAHEVERRLARNLSHGWQPRAAVLHRVRGRIDHRRTESRQLLQRGQVACRFDELTSDTPRNRYVRAALVRVSAAVKGQELAHRCRSLARRLERLGVVGAQPARSEVSAANFRGFGANDRRMVAAARLVFELALPNEDPDNLRLAPPPRNEIQWLRQLFEKAVGGFYAVTLSPSGWRVATGQRIDWPVERATDGIRNILPSMQTDIVLEHRRRGCRIVIDTKFNPVVIPGEYRNESLRSGHLYQIYAYLRSQENRADPLSAHAAGLLLHPAAGEDVDEAVALQGHLVRFATVNLAASAQRIRARLLTLAEEPPAWPDKPQPG